LNGGVGRLSTIQNHAPDAHIAEFLTASAEPAPAE
jgi:hypothetical protein